MVNTTLVNAASELQLMKPIKILNRRAWFPSWAPKMTNASPGKRAITMRECFLT